MQFESFEAFLAMGGYAFYVWSAFGVTLVTMLVIAINSYRQHRKLLREVVNEQRRMARIKDARAKKRVSVSKESEKV